MLQNQKLQLQKKKQQKNKSFFRHSYPSILLVEGFFVLYTVIPMQEESA